MILHFSQLPFYMKMRLAPRVIFRFFVRNSLQHFILFLPRGRKRTKQEKEAAARARQLAVSNEQLAVSIAFSCLAFEAFVILAI